MGRKEDSDLEAQRVERRPHHHHHHPHHARRNEHEDERESAGSHEEKHTNYGPIVRDVIIGGSDGLTVPFALTAGLSS